MHMFSFSKVFQLKNGGTLDGFSLAYETWGTLNASKSNAVLVCHALTGTSHAKSSEISSEAGWWEEMIGSGKAIDTDKYFVVCSNNIGGCSGSTGPNSTNSKTNEQYLDDFPEVCVEDWVHSQFHLKNHLAIDKWCVVIGGSLGGYASIAVGL